MIELLKTLYKIARGILFTVIILVAVVYLVLYILVSVPSFQNSVRERVEAEASAFLGSELRIGSLTIHPFNEVVINDLAVFDKEGRRCLYVETLGAGIHLWHLLNDRKIELTYAEVIGLDVEIYQKKEGAPLNIGFIIDAFKPKDKNKPPTKFDLNLKNVVLRRCAARFDKEWIPVSENRLKTDFNHLRLSDLKADINFPRISNDDFKIDLRRLSFKLSGGLDVRTIAFKAHLTPTSLSVEDFVLKLPDTEIRPSDIAFKFDGFDKIKDALKSGINRIVLVDNQVSLSDFSWLVPDFHRYQMPFLLSAEVAGNAGSIDLKDFSFDSGNGDLMIRLSGNVDKPCLVKETSFKLKKLDIYASSPAVAEILNKIPGMSPKLAGLVKKCGDIRLSASGDGFLSDGRYSADCRIATSIGGVDVKASTVGLKKGVGSFSGELSSDAVNLGIITGDLRFGKVSSDVSFSGELRGRDVNGHVKALISGFEYGGNVYEGVAAEATKDGREVNLLVDIDNEIAEAHIDADGHLDGEDTWLILSARVDSFRPSLLGLLPAYRDYGFTVMANALIEGNNADNVTGELRINDLAFYSEGKPSIKLDRLLLKAESEDRIRTLTLRSDWVDGVVKGDFKVNEIPEEVLSMFSSVMPSLSAPKKRDSEFTSDVEFSFNVKPNNTLPEFFNLPFRLLVDIPVKGAIDATGNSARLDVDVPYIQQGKNKLVRDTRFDFRIDGETGTANVNATTTFPAKKGEMVLSLGLLGQADNVFTDVEWITPSNSAFNGKLSLGAQITKDEFSGKPEVNLDINPSSFDFGSAHWNIDRGSVEYNDGILDVKGLKIWHDNQFVEIGGRASASPLDSVTVRLADIDVDYIFDTLNINYVTFGGTATGDVTAWGALGKEPRASTDNLSIKSLSYNGSVLGDGELRSHWDNEEKMVAISADIKGSENSTTRMEGGIWVTRDSLSFSIDADRVPVGFLGPFMSAFSSDIKGRASGNVKLFGTFSDIDLVGKVLADSVAIKLDYTNVYYHGTDSVYLKPGRIEIPSFRLYDKFGNSAILTGELTHRYFHDPRFTFRINDVRRMLCYDTNQKINPDWYGTFFGNGSAVVRGWPGAVSVSVDMTAVGNSNFTFVLNDTQAAEDYRFLTFSDRRKKEAEKLRADTVSSILASFQKKIDSQNDTPSKFMIDIRGSVGPSTLMTLVMDPVAGDKITARGNGNIQVDYDSESDEIQMFGKYTLEEGNYNFSLQDLILRDFKIRQGSSISFNGDPLNARLDITASYRVNTNLSDLDKSFSTDRELARTNVPVDAMLMVEGEMQHPDITFDIELPTLTQDVERKVKSIVSTDDMMSRQIIYLLALNRFYTPEYMGSTSNGGELASVASSTLSSQLSNMLGQLTDKFTVAPSFRSDKGDFSDIEVDVALSSRLLNNRLLINGNFGYRDRSTSQTTFVGDFDIEYLLNRSGNLRLKAYNHFNDQNYYLRQALTTQGLGVIYRKDFDNPFTFLRARKKGRKEDSEAPKSAEENDSITTVTLDEVKK